VFKIGVIKHKTILKNILFASIKNNTAIAYITKIEYKNNNPLKNKIIFLFLISNKNEVIINKTLVEIKKQSIPSFLST